MSSLHRAATHFRGPEFSYPGCWIRGVLIRAQERQWLSRKREPLLVISVSGCFVSFGSGREGKEARQRLVIRRQSPEPACAIASLAAWTIRFVTTGGWETKTA